MFARNAPSGKNSNTLNSHNIASVHFSTNLAMKTK